MNIYKSEYGQDGIWFIKDGWMTYTFTVVQLPWWSNWWRYLAADTRQSLDKQIEGKILRSSLFQRGKIIYDILPHRATLLSQF